MFFFRKNFINLLFSNKNSIKPQFVATRVSSNIRSLADLIGGNPTGEYSRENQRIQLFFQTIVFVLDKPKDKFSKHSIIRHSIFHQHSCIARPNWREFEWRIFVGKPGTTIIFFRNHSFCFGRKLSKPKAKFPKLPIICRSFFRQHSGVRRHNWRKLKWHIFEGKPGTTISLSKPYFLVWKKT